MKKTAVLTVTVPVELRRDLEKIAAKDQRNLSNMVTVLLQEALKAKAA